MYNQSNKNNQQEYVHGDGSQHIPSSSTPFPPRQQQPVKPPFTLQASMPGLLSRAPGQPSIAGTPGSAPIPRGKSPFASPFAAPGQQSAQPPMSRFASPSGHLGSPSSQASRQNQPSPSLAPPIALRANIPPAPPKRVPEPSSERFLLDATGEVSVLPPGPTAPLTPQPSRFLLDGRRDTSSKQVLAPQPSRFLLDSSQRPTGTLPDPTQFASPGRGSQVEIDQLATSPSMPSIPTPAQRVPNRPSQFALPGGVQAASPYASPVNRQASPDETLKRVPNSSTTGGMRKSPFAQSSPSQVAPAPFGASRQMPGTPPQYSSAPLSQQRSAPIPYVPRKSPFAPELQASLSGPMAKLPPTSPFSAPTAAPWPPPMPSPWQNTSAPVASPPSRSGTPAVRLPQHPRSMLRGASYPGMQTEKPAEQDEAAKKLRRQPQVISPHPESARKAAKRGATLHGHENDSRSGRKRRKGRGRAAQIIVGIVSIIILPIFILLSFNLYNRNTASPPTNVQAYGTSTPAPIKHTPGASPEVAPSPEVTGTGTPCATVNCNPWGYDFIPPGNFIDQPLEEFCDYFKCIPEFSLEEGYVVQCNDGLFSKSGGQPDACFFHNGVKRPLYSHD